MMEEDLLVKLAIPNDELQGSSSSSTSVQYAIEDSEEDLYNQIVYDSAVFCDNYYLPIDNGQSIFVQKLTADESSGTVYDETVCTTDTANQNVYTNTVEDAFAACTETSHERSETVPDDHTEPFEVHYDEQGQIVFRSVEEKQAAVNPLQYASINENGEIVLQQLEEVGAEEELDPQPNVDISRVFGKNLITGQTVTIPEHYLEVNSKDNFVNKMIPLGVLSNGKQLFGKIVEIQKREDTTVAREEGSLSLECVELVEKNLCAVMEIETIKEKITEKPLIVSLEENKGTSVETIGTVRGTMQWSKTTKLWTFVNFSSEIEDDYLKNVKFKLRYVSPVNITLSVNRENDILTTTKVFFNPQIKSHICILCHKDLKTLKALNRHYNSVHDHYDDPAVESMFICPTCNRFFKSPSSLRRHQAVHNPELRGFECSTCQQRFTDNCTLKKHLLLHMGEKPFGCDFCGRSFSTMTDLNYHRRTHPQLNRPRYSCQTCGRSFAKHNNMVRHARIHRDGDFKCHVCSCSFKHSSSLTRHMVHSHVG